jgi:hypothetical protein
MLKPKNISSPRKKYMLSMLKPKNISSPRKKIHAQYVKTQK